MSELLEICYNPIKRTWHLLGSTGKILYEAITVAEVQKFREELINAEEII